MDKKNNLKSFGWVLLIVAVAIMLVVVIMNLVKENTTGDLTIKGSGMMVGLKCTDTSLNHPVFRDVQPLSFTNTITANFVDDDLSTIMYRYNGIYESNDEAANAKVVAEADYNLILANDYGEKIDIFTHTFMRDGEKVALTISSDASKVTSKTAPYFLLDSTDSFPKTFDGLKAAYEAKAFSCIVENKD